MASGRFSLGAIEEQHLPAPQQAVPAPEWEQVVDHQVERRDERMRRIDALAQQRAAYVEQQIAATGGAAGPPDHRIYSAVRDQAAASGLRCEAAAPSY